LNETLPCSTTGARNFNVQPFIGHIHPKNESLNDFIFDLQSDEIAHLFEVNLLDLLQDNCFDPVGKTVISDTMSHYGPVFHLRHLHSKTHNQVVDYASLWGFTSMVVSQILDGLECHIKNQGD